MLNEHILTFELIDLIACTYIKYTSTNYVPSFTFIYSLFSTNYVVFGIEYKPPMIGVNIFKRLVVEVCMNECLYVG